jgi:O-antigen/teichoic acid export membrane protein
MSRLWEIFKVCAKIKKGMSQPLTKMPDGVSDSELVVNNTTFLFIGEIVTRALSFVLVLFLARRLGDLGLGSYSFAFAVTGLLLQFIDFGMPTYAVKELAKRREQTRDFLSIIIGLRTILSALLLAGTAAFYFMSPLSQETKLVLALAVAGMVFNFLAEPFRTVYLAHEKHHYYSAMAIIERFLSTSLALTAVLTGHGVVWVMGAFAISYFIGFVLNATVVAAKFTKFSLQINLNGWKELAFNAFPFWLSGFLMTVYFRTDTVLLSWLKGFAATGWYNAAYKVIDVFTIIPNAVTVAVYPTLARFHKKGARDMLKAFFKKAFFFMVISALPVSIFFTIMAGRVIHILYTPEFTPAIIALQILIWAEALMFVNYLMGCLLNSVDKQHLFSYSTGAYAGLNVVLNLALIPKYSYLGSAIATVSTQLLQAITLYYFCSKQGYGVDLPKLMAKPIVAGAVMAAAIILLEQFHIAVIIAAAGLTYLGILAAIRGIGKEDLELIKGIFRRIVKAGRP